jgi:Flp pilus assembly pilin Flp
MTFDFRNRTSACLSRQKFVLKQFTLIKAASTGIEYGIIAAGISVAILVVLGLISGNLWTMFGKVVTAFSV